MRLNAEPRMIDAVRPRGLAGLLALALGASLLLAAAAWIRVPMWPVPMTMQTFAVLLIGACCGARLAAGAVALYLAEAALGLPVIAAATPLGPTAGYLVGFLLAATAVGFAADKGWTRRPLPLALTLVVGEALIYLPGLAWLDLGFVGDLRATLAAGLLPFLPGEAAKLALAAAAITAAARRSA
jgi:biotin transport system substrate-specific component